MPRNISFALTTDQIRNQTKTVTRRLNWWTNKRGQRMIREGDILNACVKCMGLKPGEQIERLCQIRVTDVRREPLLCMETCNQLGTVMCGVTEAFTNDGIEYPEDYGNIEAAKEGFPDLTGSEFVRMFCKHMRVEDREDVTRIEFEYVDPE